MIILEENFKWHLEAFASELFKCSSLKYRAHKSGHPYVNSLRERFDSSPIFIFKGQLFLCNTMHPD